MRNLNRWSVQSSNCTPGHLLPGYGSQGAGTKGEKSNKDQEVGLHDSIICHSAISRVRSDPSLNQCPYHYALRVLEEKGIFGFEGLLEYEDLLRHMLEEAERTGPEDFRRESRIEYATLLIAIGLNLWTLWTFRDCGSGHYDPKDPYDNILGF